MTMPQVADKLGSLLTPRRRQRIDAIAAKRNPGFICVLEHLYDAGNVAAVVRSAEAFGIGEVVVVGARAQHGSGRAKWSTNQNRTASVGAEKWIKVTDRFDAIAPAIRHLKDGGFTVFAAHCPADGRLALTCPLVEVSQHDFAATKTAVVFGNEIDGVSDEALGLVDGCMFIATVGVTQSLNVSVAAALVLHAASKSGAPGLTDEVATSLRAEQYARDLWAKGWNYSQLAA